MGSLDLESRSDSSMPQLLLDPRLPASSPSSPLGSPLDTGLVHSRVLPNGIIEHCVQIHDKLTFLDINVDQKVISAASAPCVDLVGKKLEDVFPNDFTLQIVRNMCDEAKGFMDTSLVPRALPDKLAAFNEMPMFLGTRVVGVSGIMRVLLTEAGHFRVVLSFPWPKAANSVSL